MNDSNSRTDIICCSGCGQRLRLLPERSDAKQLCPNCKTLAPDPKEYRRKNEKENFIIFSIFLVALGFIPLTWTVDLYLIFSTLPVFGLELLKLKYERLRWDKSKALSKQLVFNIIKGLRDTASSVAVGLGIVCLVQLLLQTLSLARPTTVQAWEETIAGLQKCLKGAMELPWLVVTLFVLLVLSLIWPTKKPVSRYRDWRTWASRILIVLTVISSFTFFTASVLKSLEIEWVAKRKEHFQQAASKVAQTRQNLVMRAYIKYQIEHLSPDVIKDLRLFFRATAQIPDAAEQDRLIHALAEQLWKNTPSFDDLDDDDLDIFSGGNRKPSPPKTPPKNGGEAKEVAPRSNDEDQEADNIDEAIKRIQLWDKTEGGSKKKVQSPTLEEDGRRVIKEAERIEAFLGEAEAAVTEALKTILGDQIPSSVDALVKPFVKSLIGSSAKTFVSKIFPRKVSSFQEATQWVQSFLNKDVANQSWKWNVGSVSDYPRPEVKSGIGLPAAGVSDSSTSAPAERGDWNPFPVPKAAEPFPETTRPGSSDDGASRLGSYVTGCTCNHYVNEILVLSVPIPVGARCGAQVCGRR